jgi:SAM-dependent methyltransferase
LTYLEYGKISTRNRIHDGKHMGLYHRFILPKLMHRVCAHHDITGQRKKIIPQARGRVLEIGIGSGLNLPFYDPQSVMGVWGIDPSRTLMDMIPESAARPKFPVHLMAGSGEQIPLDTHSADTIVVTFTLCSIPDIGQALAEMRRVLKPSGRLLFCEHGRAPDIAITRWQDRLTPIWKPVSGGCHLNRPIAALIRDSGFTIQELDVGYVSPIRITGFHYLGTAKTR